MKLKYILVCAFSLLSMKLNFAMESKKLKLELVPKEILTLILLNFHSENALKSFRNCILKKKVKDLSKELTPIFIKHSSNTEATASLFCNLRTCSKSFQKFLDSKPYNFQIKESLIKALANRRERSMSFSYISHYPYQALEPDAIRKHAQNMFFLENKKKVLE